jgi:hypothetical protein
VGHGGGGELGREASAQEGRGRPRQGEPAGPRALMDHKERGKGFPFLISSYFLFFLLLKFKLLIE